MTQLEDLVFCLLAAGGAMDPEGAGTHLLYVDPNKSSLVRKLWTGGRKFGPEQTVAKSARPDSSASYILTPTTHIVVYVSSANELRVRQYDDEDDEWSDDETIPHHVVHHKGQVAAAIDADDRVRVIFQDPSKRLILLDKGDGSWKPTVLPVDAMEGGPIGRSFTENKLNILYISAKDDCIHYIVENGGSWSDVVLASCAFGETLKPKRLMATRNTERNAFDVFVLTESKGVVKVMQGGEKEMHKLGKVDEHDKFVEGTSAQCFAFICIPVFFVPVFFGGCRSWCW